MLHGLYRWVLALAERPSAPLWLFAIAFAEASFFPLPPDTLLIPMALARPARAYRFAAITTAGSVIGGAFGYAIGFFLLAKLALPIITFYGYAGAFAAFQAKFAQYGIWLILIKGLTPIPFKIVTIAAGAAAFSFPVFMGASLITRGARFFLEALLLNRFGEPARVFIDRRLGWITAGMAISLVAGFVILKYA